MKNLYLILSFFLTAGLAQSQDLVITGAFDGPLSGGLPKAVEIYVINDIADLTIYGLGSANNGDGSDSVEFAFPAGSADEGTFLYVASDSTGFNDFFEFYPHYNSNAANINGDDAIELFMNGSVIDVFGDINADGTGEPWEHLDGWAYRLSGTGPDGTTFILSNWSFSGPNAIDGETTNASAATPFPIGSYTATSTGNQAPSVTGIDIAPTLPSSDDDVTVSATILDSDGTITSAKLMWGTVSESYSDTLEMTTTENDIYTADIPMQATSTEVFYRIEAIDDEDVITSSPELSYMVVTPYVFFEGFDSELGQFTSFNADEGNEEWENTGSFGNPAPSAVMNGYNDAPSADWLVSSAIDLSSFADATLTFDQSVGFNQTKTDSLTVKYSTDYDGSSSPAESGTWMDISNINYPAEIEDSPFTDFETSGELTLPAGGMIYIAFVYMDGGVNTPGWEVDNVLVTGSETVQNKLPNISDIMYEPGLPSSGDNVSVTATITDSDGSIASANLMWGTETGNMPNTAPMTNSEGDMYTAEIPQQDAGIEVFFVIEATDDQDAKSASEEQSYEVVEPYIFFEGFGAGLGQFKSFNADEGDETWETTSFGNPGPSAIINGFGDAPSADWLVSSGIDVSDYSEANLEFDQSIGFAQTKTDSLKVKYSTDYDGSSSPAESGTWNDFSGISYPLPTQDTYTDFEPSGNLDIPTGEMVYLAFVYMDGGVNTPGWQVDNVMVRGTLNTGINDRNITQIRIYPNPTNGIVNIETAFDLQTEVEIYNLAGEQIIKKQMSGTNHRLDLRVLKNGVYFIRVENGKHSRIQKLILQ